MNTKLTAAAATIAAAALCALTPPAAAQQVAGAGVFGQGRAHFIASVGNGYAFNHSDLVLGVGATYYLLDGLGAGLFYESWSGSNPGMSKITPSLQYVFHRVAPVKPYVGAFYRRTSIEGLRDLDSVGGRIGVYFPAGRSSYVGVGAVYESYLD